MFGDESLKIEFAGGEMPADPLWAHSLHVEVQGLEPERWYWYRFSAGDAQSPVGRTRTAPRAGARWRACASPSPRASNTSRAITAPTAISSPTRPTRRVPWRLHLRVELGQGPRAQPREPEPYTLADYRARHALYRSDPDLQAAHAACPWIVTWDDHEVDNDYADDRPEDGMEREAFLERRAAAYRAYFEHMPLPPRMRPEGPRMRIHTHLDWGTLARFHIVDTRQYRSWQACPRPDGAAARTPSTSRNARASVRRDARCSAARRSAGWSARSRESRARGTSSPRPRRWRNSTPSRARAGARGPTGGTGTPPLGGGFWIFFRRKNSNPIVLGGDVHSFNACQLKLDFDDPAAPVVASEFVTTSITSQAWPQERLNQYLPDNPHILLADSRFRGYTRVDISAARMHVDLRAVESVQRREAPCSTLASFVVESGKPGPLRA